MQDSFHGSACVYQFGTGTRHRDQKSTPPRRWIERAGECPRTVPVWTSRAGWLTAVRCWAADTHGFDADRRAAGVSVAAPTVVAVAAVMADYADTATGRHCAITRARIAERVCCDPRTVTAVWRLLRAARWVYEASRGHGTDGTPALGRRPSVYHLVSRRPPVDNRGVFHLPPSGGCSSSTPVSLYSPSARPRAPQVQTKRGRAWGRCAPRPLPLQRLAAALVARTHGLGHGHIGAVCDALASAGIDPADWTARAITDRLDADMAATGWCWPDRIERPGGFLAARLRRLEWRPEGPPQKAGGYAADRPDKTVEAVPVRPASTTVRAAALAQIRATLAARRT
ncbi:hypothetical protein [Mycobacterium sp. 1274756.6]|uniref:hypothetical protein n=1 Tax=Mycobacterium sp. 1274756.6 TaxID=1834076 RepID=UPI0009EE76F6|nr:hypothetical protein [Mycobacterium sp. 1274756.6]